MTEPTPKSDLDRRKFINGRWNERAGNAGPTAEIASILVQVRPDRIDQAARAIEAMPGAQIEGRDPRGKLVVVLEAPDTGTIGATLTAISTMPHVLTASLVFHATDQG